MMDLYNRLYLQMGLALAAHGLRAWALGCHPTTRAEALPLVPRTRDEAMGPVFQKYRLLWNAGDARHSGDTALD